MVVTIRHDGRSSSVLHIGQENVARYFPEKFSTIELHMAGVQIGFRLPESFWQGQPEIRDARLSDWIKVAVCHKKRAKEHQLEMIPLGGNAFHLRMLAEPPVSAPVKQAAARSPKAARRDGLTMHK